MKIRAAGKSFVYKFLFSILIFFSSASVPAFAQVRCGTVEYEQQLQKGLKSFEKTEAFERWMQSKLRQQKANAISGRIEDVTYTIPVVVHILHNGENIGVGTNISDAQIISQIAAINRDYPRKNADSVNTPAEFQSAAGRIKMNFVLARQDPEGVPTNGITRTLAPRTSYAPTDDSEFKALSYWPAEDYLNVWVLNLVDPVNNAIAYAKLPISSLPGLEEANYNRLVDGVAVLYSAFGDNSNGGNFKLIAAYNKGRTLTHEIGHIFGLRHVWGDGDTSQCVATDYCDDTPFQNAPTFGCPPQPTLACGHDKMFQNYMDYTNDVCYNLFTNDQISRMVVVLGESPRRASLLTSVGAYDPTVPPLDLGLRNVYNPETTACRNVPVVPLLQVRDYGSTKITTAQIQLLVNGSVVETKDFALNLSYLDTVNLSFSAVMFSGASTLQFKLISVNGTTDNDATNNTISQTVAIPTSVTVPFIQPFDNTPANWTIANPDGSFTWSNITAPYSSASNRAMYMDFFDYEASGEQDKLSSPVFDLSSADNATLNFDRSYAVYSTANADILRVVASTTCDSKNIVELYNAHGTALATAAPTTSAFTPKTTSDWQTKSVSLSQFVGQPNVQISFIGVNQHGNNLYIDNVSITTGNYTDFAIIKLLSPQPVSCVVNPIPELRVANHGSVPISGFTVTSDINSASTITDNFPDINLAVGQDTLLMLTAWSLKEGSNTIKITITSAGADISPSNNILTLTEVVNTSETVIPLRQNFDGDFSNWSIVNPTQGGNWKTINTNNTDKGLSLYFNSFTNTAVGTQAWFASPVIDLSSSPTASVFFDLSYAKAAKGSERLQLLGSTDCGATYPAILFDQTANQLYKGYTERAAAPGDTIATNTSWSPQNDEDWKRVFVSLDALGNQSQARVAFVVTNDFGNNLYLDNIEFFVSDNQTPVAIEPSYAVYNNYTREVKVTFNLPTAEDVRIQVINLLGQPVLDMNVSNVLNQTYTLDLSGIASGIYIVRLQMGSGLGKAKVILGD